MTGSEVIDIARDSIFTMVLMAAPLLVVALLVGVVISLFQALTQIQEMTLTFVPKIIAMMGTAVLALPYMAQVLGAYMTRISEHIIGF